jgi:hypothetical protein
MVRFTRTQILWILTHPVDVPVKSLVYAAGNYIENDQYQFDMTMSPFYMKLLKSYRLVANQFKNATLKTASSWIELFDYFEKEEFEEFDELEKTFESLLANVSSDFPALKELWDEASSKKDLSKTDTRVPTTGTSTNTCSEQDFLKLFLLAAMRADAKVEVSKSEPAAENDEVEMETRSKPENGIRMCGTCEAKPRPEPEPKTPAEIAEDLRKIKEGVRRRMCGTCEPEAKAESADAKAEPESEDSEAADAPSFNTGGWGWMAPKSE